MPSFKWSSMERDAAEWCSYNTYQLGHANKSYLVPFSWGNPKYQIQFRVTNGPEWCRYNPSHRCVPEKVLKLFQGLGSSHTGSGFKWNKVQLLYDFMWCIINHLFIAALVIAVCAQQPWNIPQPLTYPINMRVTALSEIASSVCLSCLAIFLSLCLCYYEASAAPDSSTGRWYSEYTWSNSLFERSSLLQIKAHEHTALDST